MHRRSPLHDRQRLESRQHRELLAHSHRRVRAHRRLGGDRRGVGGVAATGRARLRPDASGGGSRGRRGCAGGTPRRSRRRAASPTAVSRAAPVPRVLVVQHHRPAVQRLELRHVLGAVEDLLVAVDRVVGVVGGQRKVRPVGLGEDLGHGGLDGGSSVAWSLRCRSTSNSTLKIRSSTSASQAGGSAAKPVCTAATLRSCVLPRRQHRQEDVVAAARHVPPAGRALLVHGHREPVGPEQVQRDVAHQLEAVAVVVARLDPAQDLRAAGRLGLEVAPDHLLQLIQAVDDGEVQLRQEVGREDHPPMAVDAEGLHGSLPLLGLRCRRRGAGDSSGAVPREPGADRGAVLVEGGRRGVRRPGDLRPRRSKNRSGGPGSCSRPRVACSTSISRPWLRGLVPGVDLVEGAHLARRDADLGQPGQQRRRPSSARTPPSTNSMSRSRFATRSRVGGQTRAWPGRGRSRRRTAATAPRCRPRSARCRRRSGTGRTGAIDGVVVALGPADLAGDGPAGALEGVHADGRGQQRGAHHGALAGALPLVQRGERRRRRRTCRPAGRRSARRPSAGRPGRSRSATSARPRPARSGRSRRGRPPGRRARSR